MKKLLFFIGILSLSLATFGQYTEDKLPSGLTVTTSLAANDYQIVQKDGESYVKAIKAYHAYLYYKKMLDSIVNLTVANNLAVGNDLTVTDRIDANRVYADIGQFVALAATGGLACTAESYFTDFVTVSDTLFAYAIKTLPPDTIENSYAFVLDATDSIVKLAPMSAGMPDFNNVAYVNYDLTGDLESQLIFDSYASAAVWINANGSPTADNHWTIVMPSGYCDEDVVADEFIDIQGHVGTVINTVSSKVVETGENIYDVTIRNCVIDTLFVDEAKIMSIEDCVINWVEPVNGADDGYLNINNSTILGGDFSNTAQLFSWKNISMLNTNDFVSLDSLSFGLQNSSIKFPQTLPGTTTTLPVSMYNCIVTANHPIEQAQISMNNCTADIDSITMTTKDFEIRNSSLDITTLNLLGCKATNVSLFCDTINVTDGSAVFYDSEITGVKNISGDATIDLYKATSNSGNINLNDTSIANIYEGSMIDGSIVQVDPTTTINDYRNTIAGSSEAASINNVGKLRYREDANNSYLEQVMKTGTSTYDWVVVKQNTW